MSTSREPLAARCRWLLAGLGLFLLSSGCARLSYQLREAQPGEASGAFLAGAARCDITPCPGYATGGHGPEASVSNGRWMPMQARAIYIEDEKGSGAALVSADLWSISGGLGDRVSQIVQSTVPSLDRDRLLIVATHSHQSAAGYSTCGAYTTLASSRVGFDARLLEFLAQRIARAVTGAYSNREPARMTYHVVTSQAFSRNRSLPALQVDPEAAQVIAEGGANPAPSHPRVLIEQKAVDPRVRVVRLVSAEQEDRVLAAAVFLATHPTAMPSHTPFYQPDIYGVAADIVERRLGSEDRHPVVALFPGALGDVSPDWERQGVPETRRLGTLIADDIHRAMTSAGDSLEGPVRCRTRRAPMAGQSVRYGAPGSPRRHTACSALAGVALFGGAEDGRTKMYGLGWREGVRGHGPPGHGRKYPALGLGLPGTLPGLTQLLGSIAPPPSTAYLGLYELGSLTLASISAEPTTVVGRRTERAVAQVYGDTRQRDVVVVGMANGYASYVATPEEYACQHYEGASTLYGTFVAPLLTEQLVRLARTKSSPSCPGSLPRRSCYEPGKCAHFSIKDVECLRSVVDALRCLHVPAPEALPTFTWTDEWAPWPPPPGGAVWPQIRIEIEQAGEWVALKTAEGNEDDSTRRMFVLVSSVNARERTACWHVFWQPPTALAPEARYRFHVKSPGGLTAHSPVFTLE